MFTRCFRFQKCCIQMNFERTPEREYPSAKYTRSSSGALVLAPNSDEKVRWSSLNLSFTDPSLDPPHSAPIRVSVKAGETLYLPVGWWHHVSQSVDVTSGRCIALNWWYDAEMRGMSWVWLSFLRELGLKVNSSVRV